MERPIDYNTKQNKSERERQIPYNITYMWNLKKKWYKWTYLQNRNRVKNAENKHIVTKGGRGREKLGNWDWHINTTLYIKEIINNDLLYITGNSTQYAVMTYM